MLFIGKRATPSSLNIRWDCGQIYYIFYLFIYTTIVTEYANGSPCVKRYTLPIRARPLKVYPARRCKISYSCNFTGTENTRKDSHVLMKLSHSFRYELLQLVQNHRFNQILRIGTKHRGNYESMFQAGAESKLQHP